MYSLVEIISTGTSQMHRIPPVNNKFDVMCYCTFMCMRKVEEGGITGQRRISDHWVWGLGRKDRAWNLRAPGLTIICMLSTLCPVQGFSQPCLHLHSYLFCSCSSPHTDCLHSHDFVLSGPVSTAAAPGYSFTKDPTTPTQRRWINAAFKLAWSSTVLNSRTLHFCYQVASVML